MADSGSTAPRGVRRREQWLMDDVWEAIAVGMVGGTITLAIIIWVLYYSRERKK